MLAIIRFTKQRGGELRFIYLVLTICLAYAVYTDLTQTRISNRLILSGVLFGFLYRAVTEGGMGVFFFFVNISIPVILLNLLFQMRALGAGDIKLFSMLGVFLSTEQLLRVMVTAFVIFAILGLLKIAYQFIFMQRKLGKQTQIHFSPAILMAYLWTIGR